MPKDQPQSSAIDEGEKGPSERTGIGILLRKEREKKGLTHEEVSEITRLRPYILAALEEEDWDRLPAPVFVRGFIRSFARALGLGEEEVLKLYQGTVPSEVSPPRPLIAPRKNRRVFSAVVIILLLLTASAYYMWEEISPSQKDRVTPETISSGAEKGKQVEKLVEKTSEAVSPLPSAEGNSLEALQEETPSAVQTLSPGSEKIPMAPADQLSLKADIRERTWVRIFVDDKEPKEYIFRPGSHPEWKARKGFDLLVGNAAGISFEFEGRRIDNLGARGQVVRLRFPEGFRRAEDIE